MWRSWNPHSLLQNSPAVPQKVKHGLPCDPMIPFLGVHPREMKPYAHTKTCMWMFTSALVITAKTWKQPKCPWTDEWISKMWIIHTTKYYSAIKRNEVLTHATTQMNLENTVLSESSQSQRTTNYMVLFIWNFQNRQIYRDRKSSGCLGWGKRGLGARGATTNGYGLMRML